MIFINILRYSRGHKFIRYPPFEGAEKRRTTLEQSEHCSSPAAATAAKVELRSDRCRSSIAGNLKGAETGLFFLPTFFGACKKSRSPSRAKLKPK